MLVSAAVLALIVLFVTRLVNHAAVIVTHGNKHMETESHVRPLFDRLAVDIAQMVKRTDVSYYLKNQATSADVNDRMAFFSAVPGYYNDNGGPGYNSRYSVVAYRVNANSASASYNKVERMAKGLFLNGAYSAPIGTNVVTPLLFLDTAYTTTIDAVWPAATKPFGNVNYDSPDSYQKYELIGPQVFRFEYYYLTSASPSALVAYPTNWTSANTINIKDVAAIVVAVATIDPQSKKLLTDAQIQSLATQLPNYSSGGPGVLLGQWQGVLNAVTDMPRPAIQGIRLYERYFYLNQ
jgi:hypothetical protein